MKAKTKTTKKAKAVPKYTKNQALLDALKAGASTKAEIAERLEALYVKNGGGANPKATKMHVDIILPALVTFGAVKRDGGGVYGLKGRK